MKKNTIFAVIMKRRLTILVSIVFSLSVFSVSAQDTLMLSDNLRLIKTCSEYIIDYWPTEILFDTMENNGDFFYRAGFADMSHVEYTEEPGYPELPIYSISLQVPLQGCEVSVELEPDALSYNDDDVPSSVPEWVATMEEHNYCIPIPDNWLYYPTQGCIGEEECETEMNADYYFNYDTSWMSMRYYYDTIPVPYMIFGSVTLNILPLHYNPEDNCLRQMLATRFVITPSCGDDLCTMEADALINPVWGQDAVDFFDNYEGDEYDIDEAGVRIVDYPDEEHTEYTTLNTTYKGNYLIIVQDGYETDMEDFVAHKVRYGYHVVKLTISAAESEGASYAISHGVNNTSSLSLAEKIRYAIKGRKENDEYLKYVLLVSEQGIIPTFKNSVDISSTNPQTDIFYEIFNTHWPQDLYLLSELYVGRWIVEDIPQLQHLISKTMTTETTQYEKRVALFSGAGNHQRMFYKANKKIYNCLSSINIMVSNTDGRTLPNSTTILIDTLTNARHWMWVYNGHGNTAEIGSPYNNNADDLLNANIFCPFAFSTGCSNNSYSIYSFGVKLLNQSEYFGTTTFYGSSVNSYTLNSNYLFKKIFKQMVKNTNISIGQMVTQGERKYYDACRTSVFKQRTVKMYNLFGDPSLPLPGYDDQNGLIRPFLAPRIIANDDSIILSSTIYNVMGNRIMSSDKNNITSYYLPDGLYIKVVNTNSGSYSEKIGIINK